MSSEFEIKVFITQKETSCSECKENLGHHAWITLDRDKGALCLSCADLDHLEYLPSGDAALTRRSRKHSQLSAVVLQWSRTRKRYERQGILVEPAALEKAERECLADSEQRERIHQREAIRRQELDRQYVASFATRIRELFPNCPPDRETIIAEHACRKYSGRVGRSQAAKDLSERAVRLAVIAHIRHIETDYDDLLGKGYDRFMARASVEADVYDALERWESNG